MKSRFITFAHSFLDWLTSHPEQVFLICGLIFGITICFRLQPLNGTDEFTHFPRAFQIESGQLWEQKLPQNQYGGYLPSNVVTMISDYRDLSRKGTTKEYGVRSQQLKATYTAENKVNNKTQATAFTSDAPYPPWTYLPSVVGIFFARLIRAPLIWYVYLARLSSLLVWMILVWLAVKLIPQGKWFIVALALLPTSITESLTVGLSALVLGASWLLIALVFAIIAKKVKLNWQMLLVLTTLSLVLSTLKQGYILLAALPLLIPLSRYPKKLNFAIWKVGTVIVLVGMVVAFGLFTNSVTKGTVLTPRLGVDINYVQQIHFILHSPLSFTARLLTQPFTKSFDTVYLGVVGILTNRLIYLSVPVIGLLYLALLLTWKNTKSIPEFIQQQTYLISSTGVIVLSTYLLIATALFVAFTQVGSTVVDGLSGRYFLPLLPLALVVPMSIRGDGSSRLKRTTMLLVLSIVLLGLVTTVLSLSQG